MLQIDGVDLLQIVAGSRWVELRARHRLSRGSNLVFVLLRRVVAVELCLNGKGMATNSAVVFPCSNVCDGSSRELEDSVNARSFVNGSGSSLLGSSSLFDVS
jgi:hypothetical protein